MATKFYDFTANLLTGEAFKFSSLQGKVVLIENVASLWGTTTRDYTQMNELHERYASKGLVVLGVPCNQFGHQVSIPARFLFALLWRKKKPRSFSHSAVYFVFKFVSWLFFSVTSVVIYSKTTLVHFQVCQQYTSKQAFFMSQSTLVCSVSIYPHSWFINPRVFCKTASTRKWWRRYSGEKNFKQLHWTC